MHERARSLSYSKGTRGASRAQPAPNGSARDKGHTAPSMLNLRLITHGLACTALICMANICLLLALLVKPFSEKTAWSLACWTAEWFWGYMQHHFETTCNALPVLRVSGDQVPKGESAVLISNHQTYADYYLVQHLAARAGMLGSCRYFAKKELVWKVPIFGWAFWAIGMILVSREWTNDKASIEAAFGRIRQNEHPVWIILYPEGTRATSRKILRSQAYAREHGKVELQHLLQPRTKGFVATIKGLRESQVKAIYDLTFLYSTPGAHSSRVPSMGELVSRHDLEADGYAFRIHVRRVSLSDLPKEDEALKAWLEDTWVEKDRRVAEWRKKDRLDPGVAELEDGDGRLLNSP